MIVAKEVPPECHPLGAENKLVFAPGMLNGMTGAMAGRISVDCKSPRAGGIKESNAGGQPAQVMARLGYAAIIIEGKPTSDDLYKIHIDKDKVTINVDNSLKLMDNYQLIEKLRKEYGDNAAYMSIGSAGERMFNPYGVIMVNPARHPHIKQDLAREFLDFLTSEEGKSLINGFQIAGEQLFFYTR